jgi:hypothetical protein
MACVCQLFIPTTHRYPLINIIMRGLITLRGLLTSILRRGVLQPLLAGVKADHWGLYPIQLGRGHVGRYLNPFVSL